MLEFGTSAPRPLEAQLADGLVWDKVFTTGHGGSWLVRVPEGGLVAANSSNNNIKNMPAAVTSGTSRVADAIVVSSAAGWAVTENGSLHKWGRAIGPNDVPNRSWSASDLGGAAAQTAGQLTVLQNGSAVFINASGAVNPVSLPAGVTAEQAVLGGGVRLSNGAVGVVNTSGAYAEVIPASAGIVDISVDYAVGGDGKVYRYTAEEYTENTHIPADLTGQPVRAVAAHLAGGLSYLMTSTGEVVAWDNNTGDPVAESRQVPADVRNGTVVELLDNGRSGYIAAWYTEGGEPEFELGTASSIAGNPVVGETLSGTPATFNGDPDAVTTEFRYEGSDEALPESAGVPTYTVRSEDVDKSIVFVTTATKEGHDPIVSVSSAVGPVTEPAAPEPVEPGDAPTISGDPLTGQTLTGTPATFTGDIDGDPVNEWIDADGNVLGTGTSLTLGADHVGETIRFRTTVTETVSGDPISWVSEPVGPVTEPPFGIDERSTISGTAQVGKTLTGTPATFTRAADTVTHAWLADDVVIEGETGTTLALDEDHEGKQIVFRTTGVVDGEDPAVSDSEPTGPVAAADVPVEFTGDPSIEGTPEVEQTLTGTPATFTGDIDGDPVNEWIDADGNVLQTGTSLVLSADHIGKSIRFRTTVTETATGEKRSVTSAATEQVVDRFVEVTAAAIAGTAQVGHTLTGTPAEFRGSPELTNVWLADGEVIEGATGTELALGEDHEGAKIAFRTIATRGGETLESTSDEVGPVEPKGDDGENPPGPNPDECLIVPESAEAGSTITVDLSECGDWAGQDVIVWLYSEPRDLGFHAVSADGTIAVTIPADTVAGDHTLAVYNPESGLIIGWQPITITAADDGSGPGEGGPGGSGGPGRDLPNAGADSSALLAPLGLAILLAGAVTMAASWRRRQHMAS
ncbi:hypothetical protein JL108_08695 [Aeromicrobium sp. YIM 150415]|nr:hypothetical protein [Aeromicrobium sp. YIM 150415]